MQNWPKKGDKVKFTGVPTHYYPHFINIGENAKKSLSIGREYTVSQCEVYSSWCAVWLEGFPQDDGHSIENCFNLSFFEWEYNDEQIACDPAELSDDELDAKKQC